MKRFFKTSITLVLALLLVFSTIVVSANSSENLSTNKTEYEVGEDILVTATGSGTQWVGIFRQGEVPSSTVNSFSWYYVAKDGYTSGQSYVIQNAIKNGREDVTSSGELTEGNYAIHLFRDDGYTIVETVYITIVPVDTSNTTFDFTVNGASVEDGKTVTVAREDTVKITPSADGKTGQSWVGVYSGRVTSFGNTYESYEYIEDINGTEWDITKHLSVGENTVVMFGDNGYESVLKTVYITVSAPALTTDRSYYSLGDDIMVTVNIVDGQAVGLFKADYTNLSEYIYKYETSTSEIMTFNILDAGKNESADELTAGSYKVVLFDLDEQIIASVNITIGSEVVDSNNPPVVGQNGLLKTDKTQYIVGEPIMVTATVSEEQALAKAWVGIVPKGVVVTSGGAVSSYWYYVNDSRYGAVNGQAFDIFKGDGSNSKYPASYYPITTGDYDIYLFAADGYEVLDKVTITRNAPSNIETSLSLDKAVYKEGECVYVTASSPNYYAWVGIYSADVTPGPELAVYWYWVDYANGIQIDILAAALSKEVSFGCGEYKAVLFNDDGYTNIADEKYFTIEALDISDTTFDFKVNGKEVEDGECLEIKKGDNITLTPLAFGDGIGYSWVGVYNAQLDKSADFSQFKAVDRKYINVCNGEEWNITSNLELGQNTIALFTNGGYDAVIKYVWIFVERADVVSKEVVYETTCTEAGVIHYVYEDGTEEDVVILPLGHNYVENSSTTATPDQLGGLVRTCKRCGYVDVSEGIKFDIAKTQHKIENATFTGSAITPKVTVLFDDKELVENTHFKVEYSNNINVGTASVKIIGIGNCTGAVSGAFTIESKNIVPTIKLSKSTFVYNGKKQIPDVRVSDGKKVLGANDYDVLVVGGKVVGTYEITVELKGNYSGSATKTYKIIPKSTSIKSLVGLKKAISVKWNKKTTQTTGYEILISTSKKFKSSKKYTVNKSKTTYKKIAKLKSGKKYFVKIRTYKTVGKTKYYSNWSAVKSVKTK